MSPLSLSAIRIVKSTAPAFRAYGVEIARKTYQRLADDPSASAVFGQMMFDDPERSTWFAELMAETIENIDNLEAFIHVAERMSERHLAENITSAHYICLARAWPGAVRDVLGLGASEAVIDAWDETFWYLAALLTAKKDELLCARDVRHAA